MMYQKNTNYSFRIPDNSLNKSTIHNNIIKRCQPVDPFCPVQVVYCLGQLPSDYISAAVVDFFPLEQLWLAKMLVVYVFFLILSRYTPNSNSSDN